MHRTRVFDVSIMLKQLVALKARSDWLLKLLLIAGINELILIFFVLCYLTVFNGIHTKTTIHLRVGG